MSDGLASLAAVGSADGSRFSLVSQLPTFAAVIYVTILIAAGAPSGDVDVGRAVSRLGDLSAGTGFVLALAALLLALMLHPLQLPLVRVLEGYWPTRLGRALARLGCRRQDRRRQRLT